MRLFYGVWTILLLHAFLISSAADKNTYNVCLKTAEQVMLHLHNFQFESADSLITEMEAGCEDHYLPHFTRANYYWWLMISQESQIDHRSLYLEALQNTLFRLNAMKVNNNMDAIDMFYLINVYAFKARLDLIEDEKVKALRHLKSSMDFIKKSFGNEYLYDGLYLTSGLYNYMTAYGSSQHPFFGLYTIMYPRGSKETGLWQLGLAASASSHIIRTEARYFLMKIHHELENNYPEALIHAQWLAESYPDNLIFLHYYYEILTVLGRKELAHEIRISFFTALDDNAQITPEQRKYLRDIM